MKIISFFLAPVTAQERCFPVWYGEFG